MDIISMVPLGIIETILCLLPIQEAVRTSILSKEWRYRWTKIPKLEFDENEFQASNDGAEMSVWEKISYRPSKEERMAKRCKFFYAMYQVLLMHEGPIDELTLYMEVDVSCVLLDHILPHLLKKNALKKFTLCFRDWECEGYTYRLPVSFLSLHPLTEMYLSDCALCHEPSFYEFGCLTTLYLESISTNDKELVRFLSRCPSLKRLTLNCNDTTVVDTTGGPTIVDLFMCCPLIEYLSVCFNIISCFAPKRLPKELPTALVHLKCLQIEGLYYSCNDGLPFLFLMIKSSPNLEKLVLEMEELNCFGEDESGSFTLKDYSDITLEHLNEVEIANFSDAKYELDFVQLVLARSPALKKVTMFTFCLFDEDEASEILDILRWSPSASTVVKVTVRGLRGWLVPHPTLPTYVNSRTLMMNQTAP